MSNEAYLHDMTAAARRAREFVKGMDAEAFEQSELHQAAVVKQLEIVGEGANRVSPGFRDAHPEIPRKLIIGMRHRLIHDYTRIDIPTVWETTQNDLEVLIQQLTPLLPDEE